MDIKKTFIQLIEKTIKGQEYQRILFKSKFISEFDFGKDNFLSQLGFNFILISDKFINERVELEIKEIQYSSQFSDLMYYRNSTIEQYKKFIAIGPENWLVLDSIQEASHVVENLEFELIRTYLTHGQIALNEEDIKQILLIYQEYGISYVDFIELLNCEKISDIKRLSRSYSKFSFTDTQKVLNKALKLLEFNNEEFEHVINSKSQDESGILNDLRTELVSRYNPKYGFQHSVYENAAQNSIFENLMEIEKIELIEDLNKKIILYGLEPIDEIGTQFIAQSNSFSFEYTKFEMYELITASLNGEIISQLSNNSENKTHPIGDGTNLLCFTHSTTNWKRELKILSDFSGVKFRFYNGKKIISGKHVVKFDNELFEVNKIDFNKDVYFEILAYRKLIVETEFESTISDQLKGDLWIHRISGFNSNQLENLIIKYSDEKSLNEKIEIKITPADLNLRIKSYSDEIEKWKFRQSGFTGEVRSVDNHDPFDYYWQNIINSNGKVCFLSLDEILMDDNHFVNDSIIRSNSVDLGIINTNYSINIENLTNEVKNIYLDYVEKRDIILAFFRKRPNFTEIRRELLSIISKIESIDIENYIQSYLLLIQNEPNFSNIDTIYLLKSEIDFGRRSGQHNICGSIIPFFHPVQIEYYYNYAKKLTDKESPSMIKCSPKIIDHYIGQEEEIFTRVENNSYIYSVYISSINGNFRTNNTVIRDAFRQFRLNTIEDSIVLGHNDIQKALDSLFNYIPFKYSYNIAILGKSEIPIEKLIGDYLTDINDLNNLESIEIRIYDFRNDINQLDENYLGLYSLNSKYKLVWFSVRKTDFLPDSLRFDLLLDLSLEMDMTPKFFPNNGADIISTDDIFMSISQVEYIQTNKFKSTFYTNYKSELVSYFVNKSETNHNFVREYYNSTSVQSRIYQASKLIATTKQGYNHISNDQTNNMLLYELHMSDNDYNFGNKGDFYLSINENKIFEDRLHVAFKSILDSVSNRLETTKFLGELRDLNLFQFKYFLSSRNKTQGLIGEAWIYKNLHRAFEKSFQTNFILLPYDLIHENMFKVLGVHGNLKDRHHPDFIRLSFRDKICDIQFIEVKTYLSNTAPNFTEIFHAQINPVQRAMNLWIQNAHESSNTRMAFKLQILQLFQIAAGNNGNKFEINNSHLNNWLNEVQLNAVILDPLIFYITASEEFEKWNFNKIEVAENLYYYVIKCMFSEINPLTMNNAIEHLFDDLTTDDKINQKIYLNDQRIKSEVKYSADVKLGIASDIPQTKINNSAIETSNLSKEKPSDPKKLMIINDEQTIADVKKKMFAVSNKLKAFKINIYPLFDKTVFGPSSVKCFFEMDASVSINSISNKDEDLAIALMLDRGQSVMVDHEKGFCTIEFPRPDSDRRYFEIEDILLNYQRSVSDLIIPFGIDSHGKVVEINFSSSQAPHLLIGGQTGSGKSIALKTILFAATKLFSSDELNLTLIDPKRVELIGFSDLPHVLSSKISSKIGNSTEHAIDYLKTAIAIMEERYSLFEIERVTNLAEYNSKTNQGLCRHLIVLDEYADIISKEELRNDLENLLEKLSQKARAAGIHLIITTQKPSAKVLSTVIRSNLPAQLALKVSRIEDSRIILGDNSGAQKLNGKGDALFNNGNGTPIRLQVANS
jgi:hypothetical protein